MIEARQAEPSTAPGGQPHYSTLAITMAPTMRAVFRLAPPHQTEGMVASILGLFGLGLVARPDLARRLSGGDAHRGLIATLPAERSGRSAAEVVQEIGAACVPDGPVARALEAEPGGHALQVTRRATSTPPAPRSPSP
jgi:hypothetical protein